MEEMEAWVGLCLYKVYIYIYIYREREREGEREQESPPPPVKQTSQALILDIFPK